jgi:hypothetical protein
MHIIKPIKRTNNKTNQKMLHNTTTSNDILMISLSRDSGRNRDTGMTHYAQEGTFLERISQMGSENLL